jgi:hypothetical protein
MTRDEIVLMARKADLWLTSDERWAAVVRFANLVAAAERSACAAVVEQAGVDGYGTLAAAAMIRARAEK